MKWKTRPAFNGDGRRLYGEFEIIDAFDNHVFIPRILFSEPIADMIVEAHNRDYTDEKNAGALKNAGSSGAYRQCS